MNVCKDVIKTFMDRTNWLKPEPFKSIYS